MKLFFLVQVYVFNFDLFEFSAPIFEKGLLVACAFRCDASQILNKFV